MKIRAHKPLFLIIACLILALGAARAHADDSKDDMPVTSLHQMITSKSAWLNTSRALTPEDLKGRIILLDFWTYCCINCMHVIPDLEYLEKKFGDNLTVIGVHSAKFKNEKDSENIRSAILRYGITHPVVNDSDFAIWNGFGIRAWPTFILIGPKGIIDATYSGEGNREAVEQDIQLLLKKYAGKIVTTPLPIALEKDKAPPSVLSFPAKLDVGRYGMKDSAQALYVSDSGHNRILVLSLEGKVLETIGSGQAGLKDGDFSTAQFSHPQGLHLAFPNLYVADTENHALRLIDLAARTVTTLAGTGVQGTDRNIKDAPAITAKLSSPWDIDAYPDDKHLAIAMAGLHQLWSYDIDKKTLNVIAGNGRESIDDGAYPNNSLSQTSGLSADGGKLYFVDAETSSLRVLDGSKVTTLIGTGLFDFGFRDGTQGNALMQHPLGLDVDKGSVYIADSYNHSIRRFDISSGELTTFAGHGERGNKDGKLSEASFNEPNDILKAGDKFYVADTNNNQIRVIDTANETVSTLNVTEPVSNAAPDFSTQLPNTEKTTPVNVATGAPVAVTIVLKKGWHINKDAPSTLALYDMTAAPKAVTSFDIESIKKKLLTLPVLAAGTNYRLQGTLYYCEDKAGSQCLIKSFDQELTAKTGGKKGLTLKLN
jgi:DNA-binding beta-propeller fold protein YncE/thiol-disulfide isomerase/thioredoxin